MNVERVATIVAVVSAVTAVAILFANGPDIGNDRVNIDLKDVRIIIHPGFYPMIPPPPPPVKLKPLRST